MWVDLLVCGTDWDKVTGGDFWALNGHMAREECGHMASNDGDVGKLAQGRHKTNRLWKKKWEKYKPQDQQIVEMNNVQDLKH